MLVLNTGMTEIFVCSWRPLIRVFDRISSIGKVYLTFFSLKETISWKIKGYNKKMKLVSDFFLFIEVCQHLCQLFNICIQPQKTMFIFFFIPLGRSVSITRKKKLDPTQEVMLELGVVLQKKGTKRSPSPSY